MNPKIASGVIVSMAFLFLFTFLIIGTTVDAANVTYPQDLTFSPQ